MGVQICQAASVFHSPTILSKKWPQPLLLFWPFLLWPLQSPRLLPVTFRSTELSENGDILVRKDFMTYSGRLVLDSLHHPPVCPWSKECQTRAPRCQAALASSLSSTTEPPTSSAPTQTHLLPGVPQQLTVTMRL